MHRGQHRLDIRNRLQFRSQCGRGPRLVFRHKLLRNRTAQFLREDFQALRHGAPDELFEHVLERYRDPHFVQHSGKYPIGDQFAVHEHAVAIEDHQAEFLFAHLAAMSCPNIAMIAGHFSTSALAVLFWSGPRIITIDPADNAVKIIHRAQPVAV